MNAPNTFFYIYKNNEQLGPFSVLEIREYLARELITLDDLAWTENYSDWVSLRHIEDFKIIIPPYMNIDKVYAEITRNDETDWSKEWSNLKTQISENKIFVIIILLIVSVIYWILRKTLFPVF